MRKLGIILIMALAFALIANSVCFAAGKVTCANKLNKGVMNVVMGWMEIPKQVSETYKENPKGVNVFAAATTGVLKGVLYGIGRTVAGVIDTATFFIPPYDRVIMEPLCQLK